MPASHRTVMTRLGHTGAAVLAHLENPCVAPAEQSAAHDAASVVSGCSASFEAATAHAPKPETRMPIRMPPGRTEGPCRSSGQAH
jgi:hypothetical protein